MSYIKLNYKVEVHPVNGRYVGWQGKTIAPAHTKLERIWTVELDSGTILNLYERELIRIEAFLVSIGEPMKLGPVYGRMEG